MRQPVESAQYVSIRYTQRPAEIGIEPSVGSAGDSYDNALAETVLGLFKTELIQRLGPWRSLQAVEWATLTWVDWFNHRRPLEPIGSIPPAEVEERCHATSRREPARHEESNETPPENPVRFTLRIGVDRGGLAIDTPLLWKQSLAQN